MLFHDVNWRGEIADEHSSIFQPWLRLLDDEELAYSAQNSFCRAEAHLELKTQSFPFFYADKQSTMSLRLFG